MPAFAGPAKLDPRAGFPKTGRAVWHTAFAAKDTVRSQFVPMATHITEECINCGACEPECPNEAISEGEDTYVIDPNLCTECVGFHDYEACQAVCPVECCIPDPERRETEDVLLARAQKLHPETTFPPLESLPANLSRFRK